MLNLISSVLQQECKQESENLDKGRITGSAPLRKKIALSPEWRTVSRIFISGPWQVCSLPRKSLPQTSVPLVDLGFRVMGLMSRVSVWAHLVRFRIKWVRGYCVVSVLG